MTGPAWFLLPVLTPILVMLAALILQRFETIVVNQADPTPVQESPTTDPSLPQYGFDDGSIASAEATAASPSRQPSAGRAPVTVLTAAMELVSGKTSSAEAIPSPREPSIPAVDDAAVGSRSAGVASAVAHP